MPERVCLLCINWRLLWRRLWSRKRDTCCGGYCGGTECQGPIWRGVFNG
jgi:hypothetical protein